MRRAHQAVEQLAAQRSRPGHNPFEIRPLRGGDVHFEIVEIVNLVAQELLGAL